MIDKFRIQMQEHPTKQVIKILIFLQSKYYFYFEISINFFFCLFHFEISINLFEVFIKNVCLFFRLLEREMWKQNYWLEQVRVLVEILQILKCSSNFQAMSIENRDHTQLLHTVRISIKNNKSQFL